MDVNDTDSWSGYLRALTYCLIFEPNLLDRVDASTDAIIARRVLDGEPVTILDAIRCGLASRENLAELLDQRSSEETVRAFFRAVEQQLAKRLAK